MEEIRTLIAAFAIGISLASLYFARRSWMQSNRPIVSALIAPLASGNVCAVFNLIVANMGNRPATNVRLLAKPEDIDKLIAPSAEDEKRKSIHNCFDPESKIAVLKNGEELSTAFGSVTHPGSKDQCLNYGAEITIEITYNDLEGKNYKSRVPIKVYAREGFGGCSWSQ
jgi:hypothetical protein